jgi:predicted ester cyclase
MLAPSVILPVGGTDASAALMDPLAESRARASRQGRIFSCHPGALRAVHPYFGQTSKAGKVSRMGTERQVMQGYLDALAERRDFAAYFTDDVIASFEGTDQTAVGRDRAGRLIRYVHQNAFDARAELKNLLVDEGKAAIEADFVGTQTGEFAGIQPTGRSVRVPYSVVYDLRGDKISGLRIYFPMSLLIEQLTG